MSFQMVFRSLREVFPQVDLRILKAVAIEHSDDLDAAAEFVLYEVLPSLSKPAGVVYMLDDIHGRTNSPADVRTQDSFSNDHGTEGGNTNLSDSSAACETNSFAEFSYAGSVNSSAIENFSCNLYVKEDEQHVQADEGVLSSLPLEPTSEAHKMTDVADQTSDSFHIDSHLLNDTVTLTPPNSQLNDSVNDKLISNEELVSVTSSVHVNEQLVSNGDFEEQLQYIVEELEENGYSGLHTNAHGKYGVEATAQNFPSLQKNINCLIENEEPVPRDPLRSDDIHVFSNLEIHNSWSNGITFAQDISSSVSQDTSNLEFALDKINQSSLHDFGDQYSAGISDNFSESFKHATDVTPADTKPTLIDTQCGSILAMDILEDFLSDVKSNKETLVVAYESVKLLTKELELHEDRAVQAKEAASKAGSEILKKAEDLKQMLIRAKEAKDMQAAEVNGEKSILATEARELQSRLLHLSDQREKTLFIIEEIQQTLEMRLAAAKDEQAAAEKQKVEREEAAHKILMEQEDILEEIMHESKRLQQEAEENAKLREFLMNRGCIVDILQGEVAVVCEDVLLLKERVDGRSPFNKSLQLTSSSLASSSSASSNFKSLLERSPLTTGFGESPKQPPAESSKKNQLGGNAKDNKEIDSGIIHKGFDDDDWELF